jgi:aminoglycoside 3-N-acetyltransferase
MHSQEAVERLADEWRKAGVEAGDVLLLHSSISRTLRRMRELGLENPDPALILNSFLVAIGGDGTLLLPLFNFDFTKGVPFDIRSTPSQMGALTEVGRLREDAVRTGHPIYSFAILGRKAEDFRGLINLSGYGADSPFGKLHKMGGKIAVLDLPDQNSQTFYHYVEESLNVPYRYRKSFTAVYLGEDGYAGPRTFELFVRDVENGVLTHVDPMGELLWERGLYRGERPKHGGGLRTISASAMYEMTEDVIIGGRAKGLLYDIQNP